MPKRLPPREHFWQFARARIADIANGVFRELVRPNFLDLREFIIIFALRNNRASCLFRTSVCNLPSFPLVLSRTRDENYNVEYCGEFFFPSFSVTLHFTLNVR